MTFTAPPWPAYSKEELDSVTAVMASGKVNYWTGGEGREFEREFAAWTDSSYAVALANGTVALDLALKALGIGPGDQVVVTPRTFIASVSCVINAGAEPVFADVERDSGNISARTIEAVLSERTRAIIPVHLGGWPCEMDDIMALALNRGIHVIEDCAQSHGARVGERSVGSIGNVGAWSFCQDKIMTTGGEGGMVTTDDERLWSAMWSFKDHGKSWNAIYGREHPRGFRWLHESFGTNWRMLEMQAAIGRVQLRRIEAWRLRRTTTAKAIAETLARFPEFVRVPMAREGLTHAFYRLYAYVRPGNLPRGWNRDRIIAECEQRGVKVFQGTCSEVYLEKAFDGTPFRPSSRLPVARELGETSLAFLTHPTITDEDVAYDCAKIAEVFGMISA
jgi:dTDP-4-amino-4,6-dideoxygalactose transaminase